MNVSETLKDGIFAMLYGNGPGILLWSLNIQE